MGSVAITFRPIVQWPRPMTKTRKSSPFDSSYSATLDLLDRELFHAGARSAVVQLALDPRDIRNDGMPRADARPVQHPGVIVSFEKDLGGRKVPLSFPCDVFPHWQANLRAIALALEALRRVDRYGVTSMAEQYRGWAQLPGPIVAPAAMSPEQAASFFRGFSNDDAHVLLQSSESMQAAYRLAVRKLHPDANGGQELQDWHTLQTGG